MNAYVPLTAPRLFVALLALLALLLAGFSDGNGRLFF